MLLIPSVLTKDLSGCAFAIAGLLFTWIMYLKDKTIFYQKMLIDSLNDLIEHEQKILDKIHDDVDEIITILGIDPDKILNEDSEENKES